MSDHPLQLTHRFIPATSETSLPTLLLLHGTGGTENDLIPLGEALLPGAAFLSPRGNVLENGMPRFFRRLAEGVFDMEDLHARTHELADFITAATAQYSLDAKNIIAVGYSNGANIAASTLLLRPGTLAGAVLLRAMTPLDPATPPDLSGIPIFIASGRFDPIVPTSNIEHLTTLFQQAGADVTLRWQEAGHGLENTEIAAAQAWLSEKVTE